MELTAIIISIISLFLAIISISSSIKLGKENTRLSNGMISLSVSKPISDAVARLNDIGIKMNPLRAKKDAGTIIEAEGYELNALSENAKVAIQEMLNSYEEGCALYIDNKLDKIRFKKSYQVAIRNLLENNELRIYFDSTTSMYKAILKVYNEWEDQEQ